MKKYELTSEVKEYFGKKLYRIKALISFGQVKEGELGGFIEKEENLIQCGNAWVSGDARVYGNARVSGDAEVSGNARVSGDAEVYGNARVSGNAWVSGNAEVSGNAHVLQIGAIGSRYGFTTFFRTKNKEIYVRCGCFKGNINEFEKAVIEEHKDTKHEKTYLCAIDLAKLQIEMED